MIDFNEKEIVLSFGAISDIHLTGSDDINISNFKKALKILSAKDKNLNLICFVGDMLNMGKEVEGEQFIDALNQCLNKDVKLFYSIGNHEHYGSSRAEVAKKYLYEGLIQKRDKSVFHNDLDDSSPITGNRHAKYNGYHFIAIEPDTYKQGEKKFSNETVEWLKNALDVATSEDPNKYVFVLTHAMIFDTCYGSDLDGPDSMWNTTELTELLSNYPQVVTFGGHLHFPLNDERSIMQKSFTSLGTASVSYMACERGSYEEMRSATVMKDCRLFSQGLFVEIDNLGNVRFTKLDFYNDATIRTPWVINAPDETKKHLTKYTVNRKADITPPHFSSNKITSKYTEDGILISFVAAKNNDLIHHYVIKIKNCDEEIKTLNLLADYYLYPNPTQMKDKWEWNIGKLDKGNYEISITAFDSWNQSATIIDSMTI